MTLELVVNPNPFTARLSVFVHGYFAVNIVIRLINSNGTVIRTLAYALKKGDNKMSIENLQRFAAGTYWLETTLLTGDLVHTIQLIKT